MIIRLLRRPRTTRDEFPASLIHRILVANGYPATSQVMRVMAESVHRGECNGYVKVATAQIFRARLLFSRSTLGDDTLRLAGGICTKCVMSNLPLSLASAHPDFRVCLLHKQKVHAFCPRCSAPSTISWLVERRCRACGLHVSRFRQLACTVDELEAASSICSWLRGADHRGEHSVLHGLWRVPWYLRPLLLRAVVGLALPRPQGASSIERRCYYDACRMWLLHHADDWHRQVLIALSMRYPAPTKGSLYVDYLNWLHHCISGLHRNVNKPAEVSSSSLELLPILIDEGLVRVLDTDPEIQRVNPTLHAPFTTAHVKPSARSTCQLRLLLTPDVEATKASVVPLGTLNAVGRVSRRCRETSTDSRWRKGNPRYQFTAPRKTVVDLFETALRGMTPIPLSDGDLPIPLHSLWHQIGTRRFTQIESDIIRGRLPIYQLDHTGQYWRDIGVSLNRVGVCERSAQGGQHVRDELF